MPSTFEGYDLAYEENGVVTKIGNATLKARVIGQGSDLAATITSDANGYVAPVTLAVNVGTQVRIRLENSNGVAGYRLVTTI